MKLSNLKRIIFDMDGVITSEYMYWDAEALTVYELLFSRKFYGTQDIDAGWCEENFGEIHNIIFCGNDTVREIKRLGVNTNWDLAYVVFCVSRYIEPDLEALEPQHFKEVFEYISKLDTLAPELYALSESLINSKIPKTDGYYTRGDSVLWSELRKVFQHWFLGTKRFRIQEGEPAPPFGRRGLMEYEQPLVSLDKLRDTLTYLKERGFVLGIGTGRPYGELVVPIDMWDISKFFDSEHCVTYTDVVNAESNTKMTGALAKPHPYVFLKAALGRGVSDSDIVNGNYDKSVAEETLVVGDAMSDFLAAKAAGFKFAAVLTGVRGKAAEAEFSDCGADYIFDNVNELGCI